MNRIIEVCICTGTTCYVLGGASLLSLADFLPEDLKGCVDIKGSTCLGFCRDDRQNSWPPFVTVDGKAVPRATIDGIVGAIRAARGVPPPIPGV